MSDHRRIVRAAQATKPVHARKGSPVDEKRADPTDSEENPKTPASKTTHIDVGVTAGAVQDNARMTGIEVGAIQGPVTINVAGPAVDLEAIRRLPRRRPSAARLCHCAVFEPETILIPAGPFLMGSADPAAPAAEQPQRPVELPDFRIGRYPVTVREYAAFVKATRRSKEQPATAREAGWLNLEPPKDKP